MEREAVAQNQETAESKLLDPDRKDGWFTKLARVERAKALRREAQKARAGKPLTASGTVRWSQSG